MSQFELVEDYLTNRLDDGARAAFEQRMETDAQLQAEVKFQQGIIESVKSARAAELKAMLNNVPIGGVSSALTGKIALATITAGIVGTALYFGMRTTPSQEQPQVETQETTIEQPSSITPETENIEAITATPEESKTVEVQKKSSSIKKMPNGKVVSPKIEVLDLTEDMNSNSVQSDEQKPMSKPTISASSIEVEVAEENKAYSFHYQFKDNKLVLYGPFDSSIYEIIEINGGTHTIFMYYKNSYYHLDNTEQKVVPLIMIRDLELLDKLEKYRKKN